MISADLAPEGDVIIVKTQYRHRDLIRQVPGSAHAPKRDGWKVPLSWGSCIALRGVFGNELVVGPGLAAWATKEYNTRVLPSMELREAVRLEDAHPDHVDPRLLDVLKDW